MAEAVPMTPVESDPGESMEIPMDTSTRADHNGDTQSREEMTPGANPVGNEKGGCY